jgi:hypothetical protein
MLVVQLTGRSFATDLGCNSEVPRQELLEKSRFIELIVHGRAWTSRALQ